MDRKAIIKQCIMEWENIIALHFTCLNHERMRWSFDICSEMVRAQLFFSFTPRLHNTADSHNESDGQWSRINQASLTCMVERNLGAGRWSLAITTCWNPTIIEIYWNGSSCREQCYQLKCALAIIGLWAHKSVASGMHKWIGAAAVKEQPQSIYHLCKALTSRSFSTSY